MVKAVIRTVFVADNGEEFPTEEGAVYAEAKAKVEALLEKEVAYGQIEQDDVLGFILNNRDAIRSWLVKYDTHIVAPRVQRSTPSPQFTDRPEELDQFGR